jgi:hypothetical protein
MEDEAEVAQDQHGQPETTPWVVKVWATGFFCLYVAAKLHTMATIGSGRYFERHWPFWAAMVAWAAIGAGLDWLASLVRRRRSSR